MRECAESRSASTKERPARRGEMKESETDRERFRTARSVTYYPLFAPKLTRKTSRPTSRNAAVEVHAEVAAHDFISYQFCAIIPVVCLR